MRTESVLYTLETARQSFTLPSNATLVYKRDADESRATFDEAWISESKLDERNVVAIVQEDEEAFTFETGDVAASSAGTVYLADPEELAEFTDGLEGPVYLDITGLTHRSWAPILKSLLAANKAPILLYVEPMEYSASEQPSAGNLFNLSDRFGEIAPIPGFARMGLDRSAAVFIPLLGFEGARLSRMFDQNEYDPERTFPIIGAPGYRPEYVHYAYKGNRDPLEEDYLHSRVYFAKANCPFDAFSRIDELDAATGRGFLKLAPIGTKPHGVGAVLYAISRGSRVELVYDHPVRSRHRTQGAARLCVYDVQSFVNTPLYATTLASGVDDEGDDDEED